MLPSHPDWAEHQEQIVLHASMLQELQPELKVSDVGSSVLTPPTFKDTSLFSVQRQRRRLCQFYIYLLLVKIQTF